MAKVNCVLLFPECKDYSSPAQNCREAKFIPFLFYFSRKKKKTKRKKKTGWDGFCQVICVLLYAHFLPGMCQ